MTERNLILMEAAFESSGDAIQIADLSGKSIYQNKAFSRLFGYKPDSLAGGRGIARLLAEAGVGREALDAVNEGGSWRGYGSIRTPDGQAKTISLRLDPILDDEGRSIGLISICSDITEIRMSKDLLRASPDRYRKLGESSCSSSVSPESDLFGGIVGQSSSMRQSLWRARRAAESPSSPVLITGETGTGKEMLAAAIHKASARAGGPFVAVNCGALNPNLAESALFGHEKGSFTGALARVKGLFELANRGTLFLDEAAELPADLQVKLLRALQERVIRRVGAEVEVPVDIRVIAATNRDLAKMLADGAFRVDLFYRLAVIEIKVPSLRERGDDVLLLANHFIRLLNVEHGKRVQGLQPEVEELFLRYGWPGNVRELRNAVERSIVLGDGDLVTMRALPEVIASSVGRTANPTFAPAADGTASGGQHEVSLDEMKVAAIQRAIERAGGNISEAARRLKISRGRLRYSLDKLKGGKPKVASAG